MLQISDEFKQRVIYALLKREKEAVEEQGMNRKRFCNQIEINVSVLSRLKKGERDGILSDTKIMHLAQFLDISPNNTNWDIANTPVLELITIQVMFCKKHSRIRAFADDCGIGKSESAKYISKSVPNAFYVPCKRAKTRMQFIKTIAKAIGIDTSGNSHEVTNRVISVLNSVLQPVVILDDLGYVNQESITLTLDIMDATENGCGWYIIGDDSLERKLERGVSNKTIGYRALFSRLGKKYSNIVPFEKGQKVQFYKDLIKDVLVTNSDLDDRQIDQLVLQCLESKSDEVIGDLRRAKDLLLLSQE